MRLSLTLMFAAIAGLSSAQSPNGVPSALWSKFKTGVNVTRWFCYVDKPGDMNHYASYLNDQDFAAFKRLHVSFVRLCISPDVIYEGGQPNSKVIPYIDAALERFSKAGIAVIWDLHDNGQLKLDEPGHDNSGFIRFWEGVARHYKGKRENEVVFEILNEPVFYNNPDIWYALQRQTVDAIRNVDPKRSIMVTSTRWGGIDTLVEMPLLPESNLIYTYHCYDPFFFTHQGASWVGDEPKLFKNIPFPSSPEAVQQIIGDIPEKQQAAVKSYGDQRYDAAYVRKRIALAANWGTAHHLPTVLGEFGSYPPVSPIPSRMRWFDAMQEAVTAAHAPNAIWGYDDSLGLGRTMENGKLHLDPVTLKSFFKQ